MSDTSKPQELPRARTTVEDFTSFIDDEQQGSFVMELLKDLPKTGLGLPPIPGDCAPANDTARYVLPAISLGPTVELDDNTFIEGTVEVVGLEIVALDSSDLHAGSSREGAADDSTGASRRKAYDAFRQALEDGKFHDAYDLARAYVEEFKEDAAKDGPEYLTLRKFKDWLEHQEKNASVSINVADLKPGNAAANREKIAERVAKAMGFTEAEAEAYAAELGFSGDRRAPFYSIKLNDGLIIETARKNLSDGPYTEEELQLRIDALKKQATDKSLQSLLSRANAGGDVLVGELEPGAIARAKQWLESRRASLAQSSTLAVDARENVTPHLVEHTTEELAALDVYNLGANFAGGLLQVLGDVVQGAALPMHLLHDRTAVDAVGEYLRKAGRELPLMNAYTDEELDSAGRALAMFYAQSLGQALPFAAGGEAVAAAKLSSRGVMAANLALGAASGAGQAYDGTRTILATEMARKEPGGMNLTSSELAGRVEEIKRGEKIDAASRQALERSAHLAALLSAAAGTLQGFGMARIQDVTAPLTKRVTQDIVASVGGELLQAQTVEGVTGIDQELDLIRAILASGAQGITLGGIADYRAGAGADASDRRLPAAGSAELPGETGGDGPGRRTTILKSEVSPTGAIEDAGPTGFIGKDNGNRTRAEIDRQTRKERSTRSVAGDSEAPGSGRMGEDVDSGDASVGDRTGSGFLDDPAVREIVEQAGRNFEEERLRRLAALEKKGASNSGSSAEASSGAQLSTGEAAEVGPSASPVGRLGLNGLTPDQKKLVAESVNEAGPDQSASESISGIDGGRPARGKEASPVERAAVDADLPQMWDLRTKVAQLRNDAGDGYSSLPPESRQSLDAAAFERISRFSRELQKQATSIASDRKALQHAVLNRNKDEADNLIRRNQEQINQLEAKVQAYLKDQGLPAVELKFVAGLHQESGARGKYSGGSVYLDKRLLDSPDSLVATLAHELKHHEQELLVLRFLKDREGIASPDILATRFEESTGNRTVHRLVESALSSPPLKDHEFGRGSMLEAAFRQNYPAGLELQRLKSAFEACVRVVDEIDNPGTRQSALSRLLGDLRGRPIGDPLFATYFGSDRAPRVVADLLGAGDAGDVEQSYSAVRLELIESMKKHNLDMEIAFRRYMIEHELEAFFVADLAAKTAKTLDLE